MPDISGPPRLIRSATGSDLPALVALYQHLIPGDAGPAPDQTPDPTLDRAPDQTPDQTQDQTQDQTPDRAQDQVTTILSQLAAFPGSAILPAVVKGQPVATCTLIVAPNLTRGASRYVLIENLVTHAAQRAHGHGTALLDATCTAAWQAGCDKVMLHTGSDAPATHTFYQSAGFAALKTGYQMRRQPARPQP